MYLNTDALPTAHDTPMVNMSAVNTQTFRPKCIVTSPLIVFTTRSVCGYERKNRHTHEISSTHQVTGCAPCLSDSQPPIARSTPPGSEKHAASSAADCRLKPYSVM